MVSVERLFEIDKVDRDCMAIFDASFDDIS